MDIYINLKAETYNSNRLRELMYSGTAEGYNYPFNIAIIFEYTAHISFNRHKY